LILSQANYGLGIRKTQSTKAKLETSMGKTPSINGLKIADPLGTIINLERLSRFVEMDGRCKIF
jgi:isocitrate/isopropylmalate dehydrogenase